MLPSSRKRLLLWKLATAALVKPLLNIWRYVLNLSFSISSSLLFYLSFSRSHALILSHPLLILFLPPQSLPPWFINSYHSVFLFHSFSHSLSFLNHILTYSLTSTPSLPLIVLSLPTFFNRSIRASRHGLRCLLPVQHDHLFRVCHHTNSTQTISYCSGY